MADAPTWEEVETAIVAWVKAGSGLADGKVLLGNQGESSPDGAYIEVKIDGPFPFGQPVVEHFFDGARPAGQELEERTTVSAEITVSLQAFGRYGTDATGSATGRAILAKTQLALELASIRDALNDAGLGLVDKGNVIDLSKTYGADFESRGSLDLRFSLKQSASEFTTYIETVEIDSEIS